jgi:NAD+ synthase/NAD+ synthase (glutamine-hydrolysing)
MTALRLTVAQLNPTVGDVSGNVAAMCAAARQAQLEQADLVIFSELSLTGYYPGDLLDEPGFLTLVEGGLSALREASRGTPGLHWVVGAPVRRVGCGKPLNNALLVLRDGEVRLTYEKQLLPTYDIFDERRHFEPGADVAKVLKVRDSEIGFLICEDAWNDEERDYAINPLYRLAQARPDLVISINASPSNIGKREQRHALFNAACRRHGLALVYVNQVGGNDQLVYDGASFAATPRDGVVFEAERFATQTVTLTFEGGAFRDAHGAELPAVSTQGLGTAEFYRRQINLGLRDYARRCGFRAAVVGCSGGIDSALTLALATEALGPENVVAITMPSRFSSGGSVSDSQRLCEALGVPLYTHPIHELVEGFERGSSNAFGKKLEGLPLENVQARVRGTILMGYSNAFGHLLLTTGNKSEISVGYCTLYGDTNGGLGLIGDLYKTEVFQLSAHLNDALGRECIPRAILEKEPSAELAPGQRDTDSLPPYPVLDTILKHLIEGQRLGDDERIEVAKAYARLIATEEGTVLVRRIQRMIARNEYKRRQAAPILRLRGRAFGTGRQMPIAARYDY